MLSTCRLGRVGSTSVGFGVGGLVHFGGLFWLVVGDCNVPVYKFKYLVIAIERVVIECVVDECVVVESVFECVVDECVVVSV